MNTRAPTRDYSPGLRVGGAELLRAFLEGAYRLGSERLLVLVPYVNMGAFTDADMRQAWDRIIGTARTTVVVRTPTAAEAVHQALERRRVALDIRINQRLHAKVYLAHRADDGITLVGSQNLTGAALHANDEVGVLIRPWRDGRHLDALHALRSWATGVVQDSSLYSRPLASRPRGASVSTPSLRDSHPVETACRSAVHRSILRIHPGLPSGPGSLALALQVLREASTPLVKEPQ